MAKDLRVDLQVMRGLAVGAVVLYHFFPDLVPTGLLGVDVFFVLSGYLITGILWRDLNQARGLKALWSKLVQFWARRARRLVPAALLVLGLTATVGYLIAPRSWWLDIDAGWLFAVAYIANWHFATEAADYLRADSPVSPYQHYWSLSVEEQFYIVLPIMLLALLLVAVKKRLSAITWLLTALSLVSLGYALYMQSVDPAYGFYSAATRVWEFGAGGLLALWQVRGKKLSIPSWLMWPAWLGLIALMLIPHDPNQLVYQNLVAVTLTVIAIALSKEHFKQKAFAPIRVLGDYSYSIYLWHWPILVLSPWVLGYSVLSGSPVVQLATLALIFLVSWASKTLIEDPIRFGPFSKIASGWQVFLTLLISLAVIVAGFLFHERVMAEAKADVVTYSFTPSLVELENDKSISEDAEWIIRKDQEGFKVSEWGDRQSSTRIALVGDSHARQYFESLRELAEEYGFGLDMISKSACSVQAPGDYQLERLGGGLNCEGWNESLAEHMTATEYSLVVNSNSTLVHDGDVDAARSFKKAVEGWVQAGHNVLLIRDNAKPNVRDAVSDFRFCIEQYGDQAATECSTGIDQALFPNDSLYELGVTVEGVRGFDLTPVLCPDMEACPVIIDDVIVYRDGSHMTLTFTKSLTPILEQELKDLGLLNQ
jgi:peptidoglycan/LPS O-acetylase OafA/YrhL